MANGVIIIVQEDTVIWCLKWNHQDCFDAAFYKDKTLLTLQFTDHAGQAFSEATVRSEAAGGDHRNMYSIDI